VLGPDPPVLDVPPVPLDEPPADASLGTGVLESLEQALQTNSRIAATRMDDRELTPRVRLRIITLIWCGGERR